MGEGDPQRLSARVSGPQTAMSGERAVTDKQRAMDALMSVQVSLLKVSNEIRAAEGEVADQTKI